MCNVYRPGSSTLLVHSFGIAYQGKDIVFRFIIECTGLRDFDPKTVGLFLYEDFGKMIV